MEPVHRAFIVGNANFLADPHNLPALRGPVHDVRLVADTITDPEHGLFEKKNVQVLFDHDRREVESALENFLVTAGPDDHLLLYYSGHGVLDRADNLYFCTRDSQLDRLVTTAIGENQIKGMLDNSPARSFIILLDCCNSGTFATKGGGLPDSLRGVGRHIVTSTNRKQPAADGSTPDSPSPFTACLCAGIRDDRVDVDDDGYVSLHELYLYVREKLHRDTGQLPLYDAGKTGDIAIARSRRRAPATGADDRPVLQLSTTSIDIPNVSIGETLSVESVDVINTGGGRLDWEASCDAPWVTLERAGDQLRLHLSPVEGMNRAVVSVRDRGRGGAQTLRVSVQVSDARARRPPQLELSHDLVDLGEISVGAASPRQTVVLRNLGGGELSPRIVHTDDWITAQLYGDTLNLVIDTSAPRDGLGEVLLWTRGGEARIGVRARVVGGPVLALEPGVIDFGVLQPPLPQAPERLLQVTNVGSGTLEWNHGQNGTFFRALRTDAGIRIQLESAWAGDYDGAVWVQSNGGDQTIDVRARVLPAAAGPAPMPAPMPASLSAGSRLKRKPRIALVALAVFVGLAAIGGVINAMKNSPAAVPLVPTSTTPASTTPSSTTPTSTTVSSASFWPRAQAALLTAADVANVTSTAASPGLGPCTGGALFDTPAHADGSILGTPEVVLSSSVADFTVDTASQAFVKQMKDVCARVGVSDVPATEVTTQMDGEYLFKWTNTANRGMVSSYVAVGPFVFWFTCEESVGSGASIRACDLAHATYLTKIRASLGG
jgi:hypothetical protein